MTLLAVGDGREPGRDLSPTGPAGPKFGPPASLTGRYPGVGSTDFWGISFAPPPLDREPFDAPTFDRQVRLLRAAWAEFDETAARVSAELRPGVRGGGRSRDQIVRHVLVNEGGD